MPKQTSSDQRREAMSNTDPGLTPDANDGDKSRDTEIPNAEAVRKGELSASQMGEGNIEGTDVQWPPGRVEQAGKNVYAPQDVPSQVIEKSAGVAVVNPDEDTSATPGYTGEEGEFPA